MEHRATPTGSATDGDPTSTTVTGLIRRRPTTAPRVALAALVAVGLWFGLGPSNDAEPGATDDATSPEPTAPTPPPGDMSRPPIPPSLQAAELFVANPGARTLHDLVESVGGLDAVTLGEVDGSFDLVRFDPSDSDRLLASARSSYGEAENQGANELWQIEADTIRRTLWAPDTAHDFAHFNADGTTTMWVAAGVADFAPRTAIVLDKQGAQMASSQPIYASRFTAVGASVFALTGDGDYYSQEDTYRDLIVDGAAEQTLDSGQSYGWIDNPTPGLLVAYPRDTTGATSVWDTTSLNRLDEHPLSGRPYQRVAVAADGLTAVGITFDGELEQLDLRSGRTLSVFGSIDPQGVDQPITLNADATLAITVERSGLVSLWWVGSDTPIATVAADAAQPRWVSERYGARSASAVAADASRVALRLPARPDTPVRWVVIDTSTEGWIRQACESGGRSLTPDERSQLGLERGLAACP